VRKKRRQRKKPRSKNTLPKAVREHAGDRERRLAEGILEKRFVTRNQLEQILRKHAGRSGLTFSGMPTDIPGQRGDNRHVLSRVLHTLAFLYDYEIETNDKQGVDDAKSRLLKGNVDTGINLILEVLCHYSLLRTFKQYRFNAILRQGSDGLFLGDNFNVPVEITSKRPAQVHFLEACYEKLCENTHVSKGRFADVSLRIEEIIGLPKTSKMLHELNDFGRMWDDCFSRVTWESSGAVQSIEIGSDYVKATANICSSRGSPRKELFVPDSAYENHLFFSSGGSMFNRLILSAHSIGLNLSSSLRSQLGERLVERAVRAKSNLPTGPRVVVLFNPVLQSQYLSDAVQESAKSCVGRSEKTAIYWCDDRYCKDKGLSVVGKWLAVGREARDALKRVGISPKE